MSASKVLIVGCGNLGRWHIKGLETSKQDVTLFAADHSPMAMQNLTTFLEEHMGRPSNVHVVKIGLSDRDLSGLPKLDLVIVATTAKDRVSLISSLQRSITADYWLIEKLVEQTSENMRRIALIMEGQTVYVNHPRRVMPVHQKLFSDLAGMQNVKLICRGPETIGIASNTSHFIDLLSWWCGGEPTYIKGYLSFLQELLLVNPTCEVIINTNLKKLPDAWKKIITAFKNLTVVCSLDAIETLGTYVRYPLGWNEFEQNVKFVSENANFLQFNLVASNLTVHKLFETCNWMKKYSNNINLSILRQPKIFTEYAVPLEQRQTYVNNVKKLMKFPVSVHYAARFRNEINYIIKKYSNSGYVSGLHKKLKEELLEQDSHRSLKLQEVDSFLHSWIYA